MTSEGKSIDVTRPQKEEGSARSREGRKLDFLHRPNSGRNGSGGTEGRDGLTGVVHVQVARVGSLPIDVKRPLLSIHSIGLLSSNMDFLQPEHVTHKANSLADVTNH